MDITTVKLEPLENFDAGREGLNYIFNLQESLLKKYQVLEGFPGWPLKIDLKGHQMLLKDFIARIIEEMTEAYDEIELLYHHQINDALGLDLKSRTHVIHRINEEMADMLHFFIETFVMAGISQAELKSLGTLLKDSREIVQKEFILGREIICIPHNERTSLQTACGSLRVNMLKDLNTLLWSFTLSLNRARGALKNKPWKQTSVATNSSKFKEHLIQAYNTLGLIYYFLGMTPEGIVETYRAKNLVNHQRIDSKY